MSEMFSAISKLIEAERLYASADPIPYYKYSQMRGEALDEYEEAFTAVVAKTVSEAKGVSQ